MKVFKNILFMILNILNIPIAALTTVGVIYYSLPMFKTTVIGKWLLSFISPTAIFWITIGCAIAFVVITLLDKIFNSKNNSKLKNFLIHMQTWLIAIIAIALSVVTFALAEINVVDFELTTTRKIGIGVSFFLLLLFYIVSGKISKVINRRIQSYETAKEIQVVGRSSIILTNILKLAEILFPEVLVLLLICFCLSWNVAAYFIVILVSFLFPMLGNIDCDFNMRREAKRKAAQHDEKLATMVAEKMSKNK